ncbi:hypothetical protein ACTJJ7_04005 [Phyllobacterium sp. 22229]|uniref:hypothetical protein n=1 Tax=Phyllobacterium TaxID=28100 RepID=UPI00102A8CCE|nr:hypothetical protein [Phyllobacterium myrsinacearum]RZS88526.1 hypothetical protein EV217_0912 [Phyllobacterium myrsinacearum]
MPTRFFDDAPHAWEFAGPGSVRVSTRALQLARDFAGEIERTRPGEGWIVSFDWADARSYRQANPPGPWRHIGPGIHLTAYERHKLPVQALAVLDNVEIVFKIPAYILAVKTERLIDTDPDDRSKLILR